WYTTITSRGTREIWSRGGESFGHNSAIRWFVDEDVAILILTNCGEIEGGIEANRTVSDKIENLIFKDARSRIVNFLYEVVAERGRKVGYEMLLKHSLTHQDIASITCTSRQTVTLVLNELRKENLIYFNRGRILVRDMETLRASAA
ncbi:MAG: Crp/Fnr family transcriptional regulator, partial [Bacteroidota bacterium]